MIRGRSGLAETPSLPQSLTKSPVYSSLSPDLCLVADRSTEGFVNLAPPKTWVIHFNLSEAHVGTESDLGREDG